MHVTFGKPYKTTEQSARKVEYADWHELEEEIIRRYSACEDVPEKVEIEAVTLGDLLHTQVQEPEIPTRTKAPVRMKWEVKLWVAEAVGSFCFYTKLPTASNGCLNYLFETSTKDLPSAVFFMPQ